MAIDRITSSDEVVLDRRFLQDVIANTEDLGELKVVLYVMLHVSDRQTAGVRLCDLLAPEAVRLLVSGNHPEPAAKRVRHNLERALASGKLLRLEWGTEGEPEVRILPGTEHNRRLMEELRAGAEPAVVGLDVPLKMPVAIFRPNVFALYEQYIGPLTPLVAEHLRDAEQSYPREWLEEAIRAAAEYNRRNWRYIQAILNERERTGAPDGATRRDS